MVAPWIRNLRMGTAVGLRKLEQKGAGSNSPSVRKQWQALRPKIDRIVHRIRPPHRLFPGEKFVSLEKLQEFDSDGNARYTFEQIRKGKFWDSNVGFMTSTFAGTATALIVSGGWIGLNNTLTRLGLPSVDNKGFTPMVCISIGSVAAVATVQHIIEKLGKKRVAGIQEGMGTLKTFLERNHHPQLRQLVDSGKFNLVVVDLENNGFRFAKILPRE